MRDIRESDWKHYRNLHPILLDRYCQQVLQEVGGICSKAGKSSHQRYLDLYKTIERRDHEMGQLFDNPKRSNALFQIMAINSRGLFTTEEFSQFSQDLQEIVARFRG
ncbi:MAG: hypothetical protein FD174_2241 [Geobacteraceae bacterium]|nr:MAG: hypothetical protein FD174_2241 [Geobacteraceae bacterium]